MNDDDTNCHFAMLVMHCVDIGLHHRKPFFQRKQRVLARVFGDTDD